MKGTVLTEEAYQILLSKFNPDQARDENGRWSGGLSVPVLRDNPNREMPPEPKGKPGQARTLGYAANGQTNNRVGDLGEKISRKFGLISLLPEGKRQNPLDAKIDGYGFEVKTMTVNAQEYKVKMKASEVDEKLAYAKENGLKPATMMVVLDSKKGKAWAFWRKGLGNCRLSGNGAGWNYLGKVDV